MAQENCEQLNIENIGILCRLCLKEDSDFMISIYDRIDPNRGPLIERICELFQLKVIFNFISL